MSQSVVEGRGKDVLVSVTFQEVSPFLHMKGKRTSRDSVFSLTDYSSPPGFICDQQHKLKGTDL